jgi:hypothetical protein
MAKRASRNLAVGLGAWCLVSVPTGLVLGRLLRRRDRSDQPVPPDAATDAARSAARRLVVAR